jgi:hypothetical protein
MQPVFSGFGLVFQILKISKTSPVLVALKIGKKTGLDWTLKL